MLCGDYSSKEKIKKPIYSLMEGKIHRFSFDSTGLEIKSLNGTFPSLARILAICDEQHKGLVKGIFKVDGDRVRIIKSEFDKAVCKINKEKIRFEREFDGNPEITEFYDCYKSVIAQILK